MRLVVVSLVGLLVAACDQSPEQRATDVCTAICDCTSVLPTTVRTCTTECIDEAPPIPDACLDCVYTYSQTCGELFDMCFVDQGPCDVDEPQP